MKKGFSIIMAFVTVMTMLFSGVTFADDTNENTENKTKESNLLEKLQIILITVHILMFRIIMKLRQGEVLR